MIKSLNIILNNQTGNLMLMLESEQGEAVFYYDKNGCKTTVAGNLDLARLLPSNIGFTITGDGKAA
ncbi:hypothetical protein [Eikenella longinqua]|uniref:hypothetical protein n=1 Tax=Eikenella longinqua TaxID=1795827 RepID=UPI000B1BF858|nr:hypothetical protein [Eikenella longinqua]